MQFSLREVSAGEPITADWANGLVRALRRALRITAAAPLEVRSDAGGVNLSLASWPRWELCELTTALHAGGEAQARLQTFDFSTGAWIDLDADEVTIHDSLGDKHGSLGQRAWIHFSPVSARWEVLQLQCH